MTLLPLESNAVWTTREEFLRFRAQAQALVETGTAEATVYTFKPSGKYYTEHKWRVPADAIGPYDMHRSPDFKLNPGWSALVVTQEPWGYPHLIHGEKES